jgi:hypothetical protein
MPREFSRWTIVPATPLREFTDKFVGNVFHPAKRSGENPVNEVLSPLRHADPVDRMRVPLDRTRRQIDERAAPTRATAGVA